MTAAVPATWIWSPTRTAREYPTVGAYGESAGTTFRSTALVSRRMSAASGPPRIHFGLILPNYGKALGPERLASAAVAAEAAGFDSGWVTDHLIVPPEHAPVYGTIAEALVSLGFLAARTQRLELGVSALLGADFERRGRLLDEWLELAATVFAQMPGRVIYKGDLFSVDGWLAPALV